MTKERKDEPRAYRLIVGSALACALGCASPQSAAGTNTNWAERDGAVTVPPNPDGSTTSISASDGAVGSFRELDHTGEQPNTPGGPIAGKLGSIARTSDGWIVVGYGKNPGAYSLALASTSGSDWSVLDVPGDGLDDAAFGNGTVVMTALGPVLDAVRPVVNAGNIYVKRPNEPWQSRSVDNMWDGRILFANGVFIASSATGSLVSSDGVHWAPGAGADWVGFIDGQFAAFDMAPPRIRTSSDAITWSEPVPVNPEIGYVSNLVVSGRQLLGLGFQSCSAGLCDDVPKVLLVSDSTPWALTQAFGPWGRGWSSTIHPDVVAIAASETRVVVLSQDASTEFWTAPLPIGSGAWQRVEAPPSWHLADVAYGAGVFVAVGVRVLAPPLGLIAAIATSPDGLHWEEVPVTR